ncbi:3989_t:CDS:2, partial [Racocetra fulgida]
GIGTEERMTGYQDVIDHDKTDGRVKLTARERESNSEQRH